MRVGHTLVSCRWRRQQQGAAQAPAAPPAASHMPSLMPRSTTFPTQQRRQHACPQHPLQWRQQQAGLTFSGLMSRSMTSMPWHWATERVISRTSRRASASLYDPSLILRYGRQGSVCGAQARHFAAPAAAPSASHACSSCRKHLHGQLAASRTACCPLPTRNACLRSPLHVHSLVPQLPAGAELHHQIHTLVIFKHFIQVAHVEGPAGSAGG